MDDEDEEVESLVDEDEGDSSAEDAAESRPMAESLLARCLAVSSKISRVSSSVMPRYSRSSSHSCSISSAVSYPLRTNTEVRFSRLMEERRPVTLCDLEILLVGLASIVLFFFGCFSVRTSMNLKFPSLPRHLPLQIPVGPILITSILSPRLNASA